MVKRVVIGSDGAGLALKDVIKAHLIERGIEVDDVGTLDREHRVDFYQAGFNVGMAMCTGNYDRGFVMCGSGMGIHIAAGKFPGVHCAMCESLATAQRARLANNANVLSMGGGQISPELGIQMADAFIDTEFCEGMPERFAELHRKAYEAINNFPYWEYAKKD